MNELRCPRCKKQTSDLLFCVCGKIYCERCVPRYPSDELDPYCSHCEIDITYGVWRVVIKNHKPVITQEPHAYVLSLHSANANKAKSYMDEFLAKI